MFKTVKEMQHTGEWDSFYISGIGLAPVINSLGKNLVGLELGVARAETSTYLLENCPNIKTYYCVDPWQPYQDWNGPITQEFIDNMKKTALDNLSFFGKKVNLIEDYSHNAAKKIKDNSLDFIFIDGDHAHEAALFDMTTFWPKVKKGGLFAGHDAGMASIDKALETFRISHGIETPVNYCPNQCWYWVKE